MRLLLIVVSLVAIFCLAGYASAQTTGVAAKEESINPTGGASSTSATATRSTPAADLIQSTEKTKAAANELLQLQEAEVTKLTATLAQLQELYAEGLIAKIELERGAQKLSDTKARIDETRNQIAAADSLQTEVKKAEQLAQVKSLVKPTLLRVNPATVLRSTAGSWSLSNLASVQQFFMHTFGHELPTSAVGQSQTHNRLGWDHRNAVDVGLHPDSSEGRALIGYLQSAGIPFLAFRGAIPGVATGPHIHIGSPSHRIA